MRFFFYLPAYLFALIMAASLYYQGIASYLLVITIFGIFPIIELFLNPKQGIIDQKPGLIYDIILYSMVPIHYGLLFWFLTLVKADTLETYETVGLTISIGLLCGIYGINIAHELGHRRAGFDQFLSKILLLSSLYMHFFIEHNRGHHKNVATPKDPASARFNENVYAFWVRSVRDSFKSAYRIESASLANKGLSNSILNNTFFQFILIEILFISAILLFFGLTAMLLFLMAALIGILLLETVNYIEHYGLIRKEIRPGIYEAVNASHSWNSDRPLGRLMLFELPRHSSHHLNSLTKYPALGPNAKAPELPTGYPGSMVLALFPALWFKVINKRL